MNGNVSRRRFLAFGAGLGVMFTAGCSLPVIPSRPSASAEDAGGWIRFHDGRYTLMLPRAEIGQNIATGLKQVALAELGIPPEKLTVHHASTGEIPPYRATVGSESIQDFALPLAQACATLRDAVASGRTEGVLQVRERPLAELRAFQKKRKVPEIPLVQAEEIVTGQPLYAGDIRLPGMAYGRVLRAPVSPDIPSAPVDWNADAAKSVPGFVALITGEATVHLQSTGIGIVAETPGGLDRITEALQVRWRADTMPSQTTIDQMLDIDRRISAGGPDKSVVDDGVSDDLAWDVDLRLDIPFAAHAAIEPRAAVADVGKDGAKLFVGSQDPFFVRDTVADRLGLDKDKVVVHPRRTGGAFGGKTIPMAEIEAAVLSEAAGRPVKVQWTRAQEFRQAFHRPQSSHRLRARLQGGRITDWQHRQASGHVIFTNAGLPAWMQSITDFVGDKGVARGMLPPYAIDRRDIGYDLERLPVLTGPWRGLGAGPNSFAIECMMDECAHAAGVEPAVFRRNHMTDPRLRAVLDAVIALPGLPVDGAVRGVASGIYKGWSYCAVVADVRIAADGSPAVTGMWCAHDCGQVINPDQVRAQCEGNMVWGIGMVLSDRLQIEDGAITAIDFADAPIPAMSDVPAMQVALLDGGAPPAGAGETVIVAAAAAITNAIRAATGYRPRHLPVSVEELQGRSA